MVEKAKILIDNSSFSEALELAGELLNERPDLVDVFFALFNTPSKMLRIESKTTMGTIATVLFMPSDRLVDFLGTPRAVDWEGCAVG